MEEGDIFKFFSNCHIIPTHPEAGLSVHKAAVDTLMTLQSHRSVFEYLVQKNDLLTLSRSSVSYKDVFEENTRLEIVLEAS